ncbi:MAG TPA: CHASE2 domain-containing protein [Fimbriimonas sp.]|nr:CHASE2 domain-containing protein [Fimbriimonas sp.]
MGALYRRRLAAVLLALMLAIAASLLIRPAVASMPWLGSVELNLSPNRSVEPQKDICIVTVRSETASKLRLTKHTSIVPRNVQAELVRLLARAQAKVVVLDFHFDEEGDTQETAALASAIEHATPTKVVLGLAPKAQAEVVLPAEQSQATVVADKNGYSLQLAPLTEFSTCYAAPGIVPPHVYLGSLMPWAPADKTIRGLTVQFQDRESEQIYPHLAVCAALAAADAGPAGQPIPFDVDRLEFNPGPYRWKVGQDMEYRSRWTAESRPFPRYEYSQALEILRGSEAKLFKGKIVVVGSDEDVKEAFQTDSLGILMGADVIAQFINSLRTPADQQLGLASQGMNLWWCIVLSFGAALAAASLRPIWLVMGFCAAAGVAFLMPSLLLSFSGLRIDVLAPLLASLCAATAAASISGLESRRFDPVGGRAPGRPIEAAILFVDLKGSTHAISDMELDDTRAMLREVLEMLVRVVRECGGSVERTMGDGALAMWFAPKPKPWSLKKPPDRHVEQCLKAIEQLFAETGGLDSRVSERFQKSAALTVGAEVGTIVGDLVTKGGHLEWSWFGMPIHLAARLQAKCGDLSLPVVLGPELAGRAKSLMNVAFVGSYELKGVPGHTAIYSVQVKIPSDPEEQKLLRSF